MGFVTEVLEGLIGGNRRKSGGGGDGVSAVGEVKESVFGGCWGLLISSVFFFAFFFALLTWLIGIEEVDFQISPAASPFILLLCVGGILSPFMGIFFGLQGGKYRLTQHVGCMGILLLVLIGIIVGISAL